MNAANLLGAACPLSFVIAALVLVVLVIRDRSKQVPTHHGDQHTASFGMTELAETRKELKAGLLKGVKGTHADERAQHLIDHHQAAVKTVLAHRLAEQQRDHLRSQGYDLECLCGSCSCCTAREYIDLIDPEVHPL